MKNFNKTQKNNEKAITLIALVITIIVLLILAGISISMLSGDNSILKRAGDAKDLTQEEDIKERINLSYAAALTDRLGTITEDTFKGALIKEFGANKITEDTIVTSEDKKTWTVTIDGVTVELAAGKSTPLIEKITTVAEAIKNDYVFEKDKEIEDVYGNKITVPEGFKIVSDSTTNNAKNVTEGIVIEDADDTRATVGSQFVWIPVGTIYTNSEKTSSKTITLGRYNFAEEPNDEEKPAWGTPVAYEGDCIEYTAEKYNSSYKCAIAKDIQGFINSVNAKKGYYIGRYEARVANAELDETDIEGYYDYKYYTGSNEYWTGWRDKDNANKEGQLVVKKNEQVYNLIQQKKASELSRAMYTSSTSKMESDLMNSYAWDTAIVFFQELGENPKGDTTPYSYQTTFNNKLSNTGTTTDIICNVYDMASNCSEWTTESDDIGDTRYRGGNYSNGDWNANIRAHGGAYAYGIVAFRPILYINLV